MDSTTILIRPLISEKSIKDTAKNLYTFEVVKDADKANIKKAVEQTFSVNVVSVRTVIVKGKTKRVGKKRTEIKKSAWKKAIVELKPEQKIDLFEVQK